MQKFQWFVLCAIGFSILGRLTPDWVSVINFVAVLYCLVCAFICAVKEAKKEL